MKLAFLSFYSGQVERGVENWISELTRRLSRNHKITIYQAGDKTENAMFRSIPIQVDWLNRVKSEKIIHRFYLDYWSLKIAAFTRKAITEMNKEIPDVIIPTNNGWQSILCRLYAKRKNRKIVLVGHSGIGMDDRINILLCPDIFISLTEYQKTWANRISLHGKIEKIPNGIDINRFSPTGEVAKTNLSKPIILAVSAFSSWKRLDLLIKAVSKLNMGSLIILGSGDKYQEERLRQLGNNLLGNRLLIRKVNHSEIPQWYRACDVFTFPSTEREAFGMVMLEAMACNKPVVATDDPAKREIVGQAGLFCNPNDQLEYASTLEKALNINFKNVPRIQAENFSWDKIADQYNNMIINL